MSPIFIRPVREQLEHDRLIRFLLGKYKRKFEAAANAGDEQVIPVRIGTATFFPDLVLIDQKKLVGMIEVETAESVNNLEAMSQWVPFSRSRVPFSLYVPVSGVDAARRLCDANHARISEIWSYRPAADGFDLVRVFHDPAAAAAKQPGGKLQAVVLPKPAPPKPPPPPEPEPIRVPAPPAKGGTAKPAPGGKGSLAPGKGTVAAAPGKSVAPTAPGKTAAPAGKTPAAVPATAVKANGAKPVSKPPVVAKPAPAKPAPAKPAPAKPALAKPAPVKPASGKPAAPAKPTAKLVVSKPATRKPAPAKAAKAAKPAKKAATARKR